MADDDRRESVSHEDGKSEAQVRMDADLKRRSEKADAEWKEYEEMRKEEREREGREIQELRERREQRKMERAEEEKRLAEQRVIEDQKKRAEEEQRQRRKREDETKTAEERERKKREFEERSKTSNTPNFVINKRTGLLPTGDAEPSSEEIAKSKEQLEAERKTTLEQRIQVLNTQGFNLDQLKDKAKELHSLIYRLESEKYDLMQQFQKQNMDMMELAERARQMNKGGKEKKVNMSQTDALSTTMSRAPPKIAMYSQYERVKDPRTFVDRQHVFKGPMYSEEWIKIAPESVVEMCEQGAYVTGPFAGEAANNNNNVDHNVEVPA